jgi:hypothetical protein
VPRTLLHALAFLLGVWLALLLWPLHAVAAGSEGGSPARFAELEADFHDRVNEVRSSRNLVALRRLPEIDRIARAHSQDMAQRRYLSHVSPEGRNPVDRLHAGGVTGFTLAAENGHDHGRTPTQICRAGCTRMTTPQPLRPPFNATGISRPGPDSTFYAALTWPLR